MNPSTHIKQRQILWALRDGKRFGSEYGNHPDPAQRARVERSFVYELDDNDLKLLGEAARQEFEAGDGDELAVRPASSAPRQAGGQSRATRFNSALCASVGSTNGTCAR